MLGPSKAAPEYARPLFHQMQRFALAVLLTSHQIVEYLRFGRYDDALDIAVVFLGDLGLSLDIEARLLKVKTMLQVAHVVQYEVVTVLCIKLEL